MVSADEMKKVAVFCAWRPGKNPRFASEAEILGKELAKNDLTLVYGSSVDGLMGVLANSVLENGGKVIAANAKIFNYCVQPKHANFKYYEYETIEERQRALIDMADAYVVFVGGFGTMFEYYHVLNLMLIGIISPRPVVIVNIDGVFDSMLSLAEDLIASELASRFAYETVVTSASEVVDALRKGFAKCLNCRK